MILDKEVEDFIMENAKQVQEVLIQDVKDNFVDKINGKIVWKSAVKIRYGKKLELHHGWKGGKTINRAGYIEVKVDTDKKHKYRLEHRIVVEKFIGRKLTDKEIVHHINLNKKDNRIENLMIFPNDSEHIKFHTKIRQFGYTNPIKRQIKNRW